LHRKQNISRLSTLKRNSPQHVISSAAERSHKAQWLYL